MRATCRAHRRRKAAARTRRMEAARERYLIARIAVQFAPDGPTSAQRNAVAKAVEAGVLTLAKGVPSLETVRTLVRRWQEGARDISAFLDRPRSGRPPVPLDARLTDVIETAARTQQPATVARVHLLVRIKAVELGLPVPTYAAVRRQYGALGATLRSAARHGVLAATLDTLPHSTVPVTRPHDVWTIDEFTMPNWAKAYDAAADQWVSVRPDVVVIQDYYSRANIAHEVADPKWTKAANAGDDDRSPAPAESGASGAVAADAEEPVGTAPRAPRGRPRRHMAGGLGLRELKGAFFAAALPEVAPTATRRFAGFLPDRVRWDHARTHQALNKELERLGITIDQLPPLRPTNRGIVERHIGTLKSWCDELPGHRDQVIPLDRLPQHLTTLGHVVAKEGKRRRQLRAVRVEDLPTVETLRRAFDKLVWRYNTAHEHRGIGGATPLAAYVEGIEEARERGDHPRTGRDILAMERVRTTRVTLDGVVHRTGGLDHRFSFSADGVWLAVGTELEYRPDPLQRGLFTTVLGREVFLEPLAKWAAKQRPAAVAEQQEAMAEQVAAEVDAARLTRAVVTLATTALANADAEFRADAAQPVAPPEPSAAGDPDASEPLPPATPAPAPVADAEFCFDEPLPPPPGASGPPNDTRSVA